VDGYVEQTSMANPHAKITYVAPGGERTNTSAWPRSCPSLLWRSSPIRTVWSWASC